MKDLNKAIILFLLIQIHQNYYQWKRVISVLFVFIITGANIAFGLF
jgi:hypothetical protein